MMRKDLFWRGTGRQRPVAKIHTKHAFVSMRDIAAQHPGSVYASLIAASDWLSKLRISSTAKRLSRLQGPSLLRAFDREIKRLWKT